MVPAPPAHSSSLTDRSRFFWASISPTALSHIISSHIISSRIVSSHIASYYIIYRIITLYHVLYHIISSSPEPSRPRPTSARGGSAYFGSTRYSASCLGSLLGRERTRSSFSLPSRVRSLLHVLRRQTECSPRNVSSYDAQRPVDTKEKPHFAGRLTMHDCFWCVVGPWEICAFVLGLG